MDTVSHAYGQVVEVLAFPVQLLGYEDVAVVTAYEEFVFWIAI